MGVAERVDEIAGLQPGHLGHHHRQQRIGSDVERFSTIHDSHKNHYYHVVLHLVVQAYFDYVHLTTRRNKLVPRTRSYRRSRFSPAGGPGLGGRSNRAAPFG